MSTPLISILMPVRDAMPFLAECLDSIQAQDFSEWELIAVNDHSQDESSDLLHACAAKDGRIRVLQNTRKGIIPALRLAYSESRGRLITRMDADDRMSTDKLTILSNALLERGMGHVATGLVQYFSETGLGDGYRYYQDWLNGLSQGGTNFSDIYRECVIPSPCWMVFREDLDRCDAFSPNVYPEDYDLCFRFYRENLNVIPAKHVLHYWRDHAGRTSRNDPHYADNSFLDLKIRWFLKLDHLPERPLVVWGGGRKGKTVAQLLQQADIPFVWCCENPNKIGKDIYGVRMLEAQEAVAQHPDAQVIVSVGNPQERSRIAKHVDTDRCFLFS